MNDYTSLKLLDRISWIFNRLGVNYPIMRKIIRAKLTMDRRQKTVAGNNKKDSSSNYTQYIISTLFIGGFNLLIMVLSTEFMLRYAFVLGVSIFMIALNLISDFSSVLLDTKEKELLGSKPIDDRTLSTSKFVHIMIYLFTTSLCYSGLSVLGSFYKDGIIIGIIYILLLIASNILIVVFTALFYTVLLRYSSGEKLKDIINVFQTILSVISILAYQFLRFAFNLELSVEFTYKWWNIFIPSIVLSSPLYIIKTGNINAYSIIFSIITVLLPIVGLILYIKVIIPYFENNLYKINLVAKNKKQKKSRFIKHIARLICRDKQERAVFIFTSNMINSDRKFKQSIYPSLAMSVIFPFIMVIPFVTMDGLGNIRNNLYNSNYHLFIYFGTMMLITIITLLGYSEKYKGAWIFEALPIADKKLIKRGAFKCFMLRFSYPILIIHSIIFTLLGGVRVLNDLIAIFMVLTASSLIVYNKYYFDIPFSRDYSTTNESKNVGGTLLIGVIIAIWSLLHRFVKGFEYGVLLYTLLSIVITIVLWYRILIKPKKLTIEN